MFQRLGQRFGKSKQKTKQLQQRGFKDLVGQDNAPQQVSSDSLRSLLKTAIADAEQIVASIKMRAQTEAEAEAARIIAQVKLEAEEIKGRAEIAVQKQAEDILSAANRKAEITVEGAKQKALQFQPQEKAVEEKIEQTVQLEEEATVSEAVEVITEEHLPEERPGREEHKPAPVKLDSRARYSGEVELIIAAPLELKLVSKLYNYLQTIPELRILYTRGSWDQGTTIAVVLEKPIPLISLISEMPGVEVTPELLKKESLAKGKSSSLLRGEKGEVKRIKLVLKEA